MDLSIIILSWNSSEHIEKCLSSVIGCIDRDFSYEIFVIDNGSHDTSHQVINNFKKQYPDNVKPILLNVNTGTTYSRNLALKQAGGDYIIVMDSDVQMPRYTIQKLIAVMQKEKGADFVVPKLVYGNGKFQQSTDKFPTIFTKLNRFFFLKRMEQKADAIKESLEIQKVDYAISAMWLFKKEVLENVGLLDENIFYAPEDVDYCLRVWKAGYQILYVPAVYATHHAQEISRGFRFNKATFEHVKGLLYFFKKHKYCFCRPTFTRS